MQRFSHDKPCSDHLGNIYGSIKAMCSFWHIKPETYSRRLTVYNMTVEEALTRPVKHLIRDKPFNLHVQVILLMKLHTLLYKDCTHGFITYQCRIPY